LVSRKTKTRKGGWDRPEAYKKTSETKGHPEGARGKLTALSTSKTSSKVWAEEGKHPDPDIPTKQEE